MDGTMKFLIFVFCLMLVFCVYGCTRSIKQHESFREACIAKGGVPFQPKHDWICLKQEQVQEL